MTGEPPPPPDRKNALERARERKKRDGGKKEWPNVERGRREIETVAMSLKPSVRRCAGGWRDIHVRPDDDRPGLFNSLASHGCVRAMPPAVVASGDVTAPPTQDASVFDAAGPDLAFGLV
jgi:hypothetical protein